MCQRICRWVAPAWLVTAAASQREIEAGAEVLAGAGDVDHPNGLVRRGSVDDVDQTEHHVVGQGIATIGPIKADSQHPTVVFDDKAVDRCWIRFHRVPHIA